MNIALIRKAKGWSQEDLAEVSGVKQPTISKVENGNDSVTLRTLKAIAAALDVPLYQLFTDDTVAAELILLNAYRNLSPERRRGWEDMARAAIAERPPADQ